MSGRLDWKRKHGDLANSLLIKACTLSKQLPAATRILDATGGLGSDAFMLASRGFPVLVWERHPVVFALLRDGVERAQLAHPDCAAIAHRLTVRLVDSVLGLASLPAADAPDVIYLDSMYPPPVNLSKAALPKKGMQFLRQIGGSSAPDGPEIPALVRAALATARHRVVLKRPTYVPLALTLPDEEKPLLPAHSWVGDKHRFDAFLSRPKREGDVNR